MWRLTLLEAHKKATKHFFPFEMLLKNINFKALELSLQALRVSIRNFGCGGGGKKREKKVHFVPKILNTIQQLLRKHFEALVEKGENKIHIRYQYLLCLQFFALLCFIKNSINMCLFRDDKRNMTLETSKKLCKFFSPFLLCCHVFMKRKSSNFYRI
jgi:hypothetical protein